MPKSVRPKHSKKRPKALLRRPTPGELAALITALAALIGTVAHIFK